MKCPMIVAGNKINHITVKDPSSDCLKEECAWWDEAFEHCCVRGLVSTLRTTNYTLLEIVKKMPHEGQFRK